MRKSALSVASLGLPGLGTIVGALLLSQVVAAGESRAESERYQLVPDAQVPGAKGKAETRALLLDSSTGRTWIMVRDEKANSGSGMKWLPVDFIYKEQAKREARAATPNSHDSRATLPKPTFERDEGRNSRLNLYDNDP